MPSRVSISTVALDRLARLVAEQPLQIGVCVPAQFAETGDGRVARLVGPKRRCTATMPARHRDTEATARGNPSLQ